MKEAMINKMAELRGQGNQSAVKKDADYSVVDYFLKRKREEAQRKAKHNAKKQYYEAKKPQEADDDEEGSDSTDTSTV